MDNSPLAPSKPDIQADFACILCGEHNFSLFHDRERNGEVLNNFICRNCGFIFVYPRPEMSNLKETYIDGKFSMEVRGAELPTDKKILQLEKKAYKRMLLLEREESRLFKHPSADKNILEIGCGIGSFLRYFENMGWSVKGIEPDEAYAKFGSDWYDIDVESIFLEDFQTLKRFEVIASFHVIEHVSNPRQFLNICHSLMKDDGVLFIECPSIDFQYGDNQDYFFWKEHINTFSNKTLTSLLKSCGFEIQKVSLFDGALNIIAKKTSATDSNILTDSADRLIKLKSGYQPKRKLPQVKWAINEARIWKFEDTENAKNVFKYLLHKHIFRKFKLPKSLSSKKHRMVHIGHTNYGNVGDTVLFECVRKLIDSQVQGGVGFVKVNTSDPVDERIIKMINDSDGLVIGGGGLFLKDSNPNQLSGWQWPCSISSLEKIKVPIYIVAVGYNRFREQGEFDEIFTDNIKLLFSKSSLIGIRNHGSINEIRKYVPEHAAQIKFQPCPTTFALHYHEDLNGYNPNPDSKKIGINLAFDRHMKRFGKKESAIVREILEAANEMTKMGFEVTFFGHAKFDKDLRYYLKNDRYTYDYVDLSYATTTQLFDFYKPFKLIFGMRGHSQMIPFGMGIPIYSIISHNKLFYLLQDTEMTECGVEIQDSEIKAKMVHFVRDLDFEKYHQHIIRKSRELYDLTLKNLAVINQEMS